MSMYDKNNFYILMVFKGGCTIRDIEYTLEKAIEKVKELNDKNTNKNVSYCYLDDSQMY